VIAEYGRPSTVREGFLQRHPGFDFDRFERALTSYQEGRYKLILSERGERELYDLEADPGELRDLTAELPAVADDLQAKIQRWQAAGPTAAPVTAPVELDEKTIQVLRDLGYVE
jgi:arylsulfatase A-like enzyme